MDDNDRVAPDSKIEAGVSAVPITRASLPGLGPLIAPRTAAESAMADIWRPAFNIDELGVEDDFFDLQGDSLIATTIATEVSTRFEVDFQPSLIVTYPTAASMAAYVEAQPANAARLPTHLVPVRTAGNLPPLFLIHGLFGIFFPNQDFLDALDPEQPVYFLQAIGFLGEADPPKTVEDIAAAYLKAIRLCQPQGRLNIAAFCAGSLIAIEIGHQLNRAGDAPNPLILVDPPMPYALKRSKVPLWARMAFRRVRDFPEWLLRNTLGRTGLLGSRWAPDAEFQKRLRRLPGDRESLEKFATPAAKEAHDALEHALITYKPEPYAGRAEVITSRTRMYLFEDESLPWRRLLGDFGAHVGVEDHTQLFGKEIASMGRALQACLAAGYAAAKDGPADGKDG